MRRALLVLAGCGRIGFGPLLGGGSGDGGTGDGRIGDGMTGDGVVASSDAPPGTLFPAPIADTYLQGPAAGPFGSSVQLLVGRSAGAGNNLYALIWFDLSSLPTTPITTAKLRLYQYASAGSTAIAMEVRRELQTWDEATAVWNDASTGVTWNGGASVGGYYSSNVYATLSVTPGNYGSYEWDVTTLVNEWLTGTSPNYGLEVLHSVSPPTGDSATFGSRENTTVAYRPQLLVTP